MATPAPVEPDPGTLGSEVRRKDVRLLLVPVGNEARGVRSGRRIQAPMLRLTKPRANRARFRFCPGVGLATTVADTMGNVDEGIKAGTGERLRPRTSDRRNASNGQSMPSKSPSPLSTSWALPHSLSDHGTEATVPKSLLPLSSDKPQSPCQSRCSASDSSATTDNIRPACSFPCVANVQEHGNGFTRHCGADFGRHSERGSEAGIAPNGSSFRVLATEGPQPPRPQGPKAVAG